MTTRFPFAALTLTFSPSVPKEALPSCPAEPSTNPELRSRPNPVPVTIATMPQCPFEYGGTMRAPHIVLIRRIRISFRARAEKFFAQRALAALARPRIAFDL